MGTVITDVSSAATVSHDLVADRSICSKIALSILCCVQLALAWASAVVYLVQFLRAGTYDDSQIELILTFGLLVLGYHVVPGIASGIVYYRRFKKSTRRTRQKVKEEYKEAWVCLRIVLIIMGLGCVARYVETLTAINKLITIEKVIEEEKGRVQKNIEQEIATSRGNSRVSGSGSRLSGQGAASRLSEKARSNNNYGAESAISAGGRSVGYASVISGTKVSLGSIQLDLDEPTERKLRRAKRQFRRCENDSALVALVSGAISAAPMSILQLCFIIRRDQNSVPFDIKDIMSLIFIVVSIFWTAGCFTHFYPARRVTPEPEFERGIGAGTKGLILLYLSHVTFLLVRIIAVAFFSSWHTYWVFVPIAFHFILEMIIIIAYRCYMRPAVAHESASTRVTSLSSQIPGDLFMSYANIFDFINNNEGKTRLRYLIHYAWTYIENLSMIVVWYLHMKRTAAWYRLPGLIIVLVAFFIGFLLLQLYYYYCHPNPISVSLCGLCQERDHHNYNQESFIREPVLGAPIGQNAVPFWQDRDESVRASQLSNIQSKPPASVHSGHFQPARQPYSPNYFQNGDHIDQSNSNISIASPAPKPFLQQPPHEARQSTPSSIGGRPPTALKASKPPPPKQLEPDSDDSSSSSDAVLPQVRRPVSQPGVFVPKSAGRGSRPASHISSGGNSGAASNRPGSSGAHRPRPPQQQQRPHKSRYNPSSPTEDTEI